MEKLKLIYPINLQLFAERSDETGDDENLELEQEDTEFELDDEDETDELEDIPDDDTDEKPEDGTKGKQDDKPDGKGDDKSGEKPQKKDKYIPLSAFKKETQRLKRQINELKQKLETGTKDSSVKVSKQSLIDAGFDEATAEALAGVYGKSTNVEKLVNKKFMDMEFKELAKEFPDIEDYRDELEEYATLKGVSIEEAYMAKYGRSKLKANRADLEREIEQRVLDRLRKQGNMKFDTTNNGEVENKKSQLTPEERQAAKFLGMSEREYLIFSKGKSMDTFEKHFKKKG